MNYYGIAGNAQGLRRFWNFVKSEWKYSLTKRSQNERVSWERLSAFLEMNPMVAPQIKISYGQLAS